ncbi:MAG: DUF3467 domain-containing protein [Planctomycetota bacterium]
MTNETAVLDQPASPAADRPRSDAQQIQVDDIGLEPLYTNFCRVTGTPEEVIIDFGLNTEPFGRSTHAIKLQQRMVANFYTAKRLLMALSVAIQRHEKAFGVLETDVNKRLKGS